MNDDRGSRGEDALRAEWQAGRGGMPDQRTAGVDGRPLRPADGPAGVNGPTDPDAAARADADAAGPPPAAPGGGAAGQQGRRRRRKSRSWWIELPILLVLALVLALLIKTFVVQAFYIPSSSMENTLQIGDKVLVNKLVYDFRPIDRGDIVVFNGDGSWYPEPLKPKPPLVRLWHSITGLFGSPPGAHDYIKRVIGVPGDHVVCCNRKGQITVNGVPLQERSYLYPENAPSTTPFNIVVPRGRLWVMGDHRDVSADSRSHMSDPGRGTIPEGQVVGRAFLIIAPFSRWRILPIPATFGQPRLARAAAALAAAPGAPLAAGLAGAFPLMWLQRRLRRMWLRRRRRRRVRGLARRRPAAAARRAGRARG